MLPPALMILSVRQYLERTAAAVDEIRDANTKLRRAHRDTIAALSRSMEAKDAYTGGHTERVAAVAVGLARQLGFEHDDLEAIGRVTPVYPWLTTGRHVLYATHPAGDVASAPAGPDRARD